MKTISGNIDIEEIKRCYIAMTRKMAMKGGNYEESGSRAAQAGRNSL
jgi:hypothetical protein